LRELDNKKGLGFGLHHSTCHGIWVATRGEIIWGKLGEGHLKHPTTLSS